MVESHAFISADTISFDSRAACKYRWCLYIYVLSVNLRVPGSLTACTTDIVLMSEGGCKYSRCKRRPVIRSTACNQPTYLKLAGSGDGIDLWGVSWWHMTLTVSGQWGWFTVTCHGGAWLDRGYRIDLWGHAMGTHITGWIGAMGLNHGDMWHWLDQGNGVDLWRCVALAERGDGIDSGGACHWGYTTLAGSGWWDWFMGVCRGACNTGWIGAMGLIYGIHHGHTTGSGKWDWFEGARHWGVTLAGTCHGGATGSKRWDWFVGARHGGATLAGCEWWDWFMGVFHGGAQLDRGDGIDLWRGTMGAHRAEVGGLVTDTWVVSEGGCASDTG